MPMSRKENNLLVDILRTASDRRAKTVSVYRTILAEVESKVRRRLAEGAQLLVFDFPIVKPGLPTYDIESCARYVVKRLNSRGLDTAMLSPSRLQVSWARLLQTLRRQRVDLELREHRRRGEDRKRRKREAREQPPRAAPGRASPSETHGPPVPPHANDPDDLFSIPTVRRICDV